MVPFKQIKDYYRDVLLVLSKWNKWMIYVTLTNVGCLRPIKKKKGFKKPTYDHDHYFQLDTLVGDVFFPHLYKP